MIGGPGRGPDVPRDTPEAGAKPAAGREPGLPPELDGAPVLLRTMTVADIAIVLPLERRLFASDAWSEEIFRSELREPSRLYSIVLTPGASPAVIGYMGMMWYQSDGDIQTIGVAPEFQGKGIGRWMLNVLLRQLGERGVRNVLLEVRADNPSAQQLYSSTGFVKIAERPGYYQPDGVDAWVMQLDL